MGTLKGDRKWNPKQVINKELKLLKQLGGESITEI